MPLHPLEQYRHAPTGQLLIAFSLAVFFFGWLLVQRLWRQLLASLVLVALLLWVI